MAFMFFKEAVGVKAIADVKSYFTIHFIKCCMYVDNKLRDVFEALMPASFGHTLI